MLLAFRAAFKLRCGLVLSAFLLLVCDVYCKAEIFSGRKKGNG